jgi:bifunctional DNase/RNase
MQEFLNAEIWSIAETGEGCAVFLRPRDFETITPIFIGRLETQSILVGREGIRLQRPLTHDLILTMLHKLRLTLERVEIHELRNDTFHARLIITGGDYTGEKPLVLDSRSSDAIALAVRQKCPILLALAVIEQAGIPLDYFMETATGRETLSPEEAAPPRSPQAEHRRLLLEQLNRAVAAEEYERAAEIRDMIQLLEAQDGALE